MSGTKDIQGSGETASPVESWLCVSKTGDPDIYKLEFAEHHIGNPLIRSMHGGVVASMIEYAAEKHLDAHLQNTGTPAEVELFSSSIEYLRVTKDAPLYARAKIVRVARRVAFIEVRCWQDEEDLPVSRGSCSLRIKASA